MDINQLSNDQLLVIARAMGLDLTQFGFATPDGSDCDAADPPGAEPDAGPEGEEPIRRDSPLTIRLSTVRPRAVEWLWTGRIPLGHVTVVLGPRGTGKSMLAADIAARASAGLP